MRIEELGFGLAAITALTIPPAGAVAIENSTRSSFDGDVGSGNRDKGSRPCLVAECGGTFKDDLCAGIETSQVKSGSRWHSNVGQDNG